MNELLRELNRLLDIRQLPFWKRRMVNRRIGKLLARMPTAIDKCHEPYIGPDGYITLYRGTRLAEYALLMMGKYDSMGVWWSNTSKYASLYATGQERITPGLSCVLFVEIPAKYIKFSSLAGPDGIQVLFSPAQALPHARRMGRIECQ